MLDVVGNLFCCSECDDWEYGFVGQLLCLGDICYCYNVEGNFVEKIIGNGENW